MKPCNAPSWRSLPDPPPETAQQALACVSQTLVEAIRAFEADHLPQTQVCLEETFARLLIAMKRLDINAEMAMERVLLRFAQAASQPRRFLFFGDRVEIRVGDEVRGGWPIFGQQDYEAAVALARTFGCDVAHADSRQLSLFAAQEEFPALAPTATRRRLPVLRRRATSSCGEKPSLRLIRGRQQPVR